MNKFTKKVFSIIMAGTLAFAMSACAADSAETVLRAIDTQTANEATETETGLKARSDTKITEEETKTGATAEEETETGATAEEETETGATAEKETETGAAAEEETDTKAPEAADAGEEEAPETKTTEDVTGTDTENDTTAKTGTADDSEKTSAKDADEYFTSRDLTQTADLSSAVHITVTSGQDVTITEEGVYVLSGNASDCTVMVDADDAKVQLVLDGLSITNTSDAAIYVISADKVFITTAEGSENTLKTTGTFALDGDTNVDAVIFSKDDLVLNGLGTLTVISTKGNAVTSKDDLKVTGGTYIITAGNHGLEAHDSIRICDGSFTVNASKDGLHAEYDEDDSVGYIYISGGSFNITAKSDGIQATTTLVIDGGSFEITAEEGLEATNITINDGTIYIKASDDGINASSKSSKYDVLITINGGEITIVMGSGDTDAIDSNGSIVVNGGYINITGNSSFDYDVSGVINGGTVIVNGQQITSMPNQMMGGGMGGGFVNPGGNMNPGGWGGMNRGQNR